MEQETEVEGERRRGDFKERVRGDRNDRELILFSCLRPANSVAKLGEFAAKFSVTFDCTRSDPGARSRLRWD